ncbi:MAG: hypothetical protein PHV09_06085 [Bacteroidales bacterium]|nr:hypothetical protein [Bacteroidales bacterium]
MITAKCNVHPQSLSYSSLPPAEYALVQLSSQGTLQYCNLKIVK